MIAASHYFSAPAKEFYFIIFTDRGTGTLSCLAGQGACPPVRMLH